MTYIVFLSTGKVADFSTARVCEVRVFFFVSLKQTVRSAGSPAQVRLPADPFQPTPFLLRVDFEVLKRHSMRPIFLIGTHDFMTEIQSFVHAHSTEQIAPPTGEAGLTEQSVSPCLAHKLGK